MLAFYREMVMVAYDPAMAAAAGVRAWFFEYALLVLIALAVVVALQAIGIVLVSAMLIIPPATASLLARRIPQIIALSFVLSVGASLLGLYASFHADVAASPAIVMAATAAFAVTLAATTRRGVRLPAGVGE